MNTLFHSSSEVYPPPRSALQPKLLPVLEKVKEAYKLWFNYRDTFPKKSRYTLGDKIDRLFLTLLDLVNLAAYQKTEEKLVTLTKSILVLDSLIFFLQISFEVRLLDTQKYLKLSESLHEIGKMLGGWKKGLEAKQMR